MDIKKLRENIVCKNICNVTSFRTMRDFFKPQEPLLYKYLLENKYIKDDTLTTGIQPFNYFARIGSGKPNFAPQYNVNETGEFVVCHKLEKDCEQWNNPNYKSGAMAGSDENGPGHVFITTTNLFWKYFNILTITDVEFLKRMRDVALKYVEARGWTNYGFFFHCLPCNSVHSLHLHVVNLDRTGPHYDKRIYKNLPIEDAIEVIANLELS